MGTSRTECVPVCVRVRCVLARRFDARCYFFIRNRQRAYNSFKTYFGLMFSCLALPERFRRREHQRASTRRTTTGRRGGPAGLVFGGGAEAEPAWLRGGVPRVPRVALPLRLLLGRAERLLVVRGVPAVRRAAARAAGPHLLLFVDRARPPWRWVASTVRAE